MATMMIDFVVVVVVDDDDDDDSHRGGKDINFPRSRISTTKTFLVKRV